MNKLKCGQLILPVCLAVLLVGCESVSDVVGDDGSGGSSVDLSGAAVQGAFDFRGAKETVKSTGASINGEMVTVSWEAHDVWPGSDGSCDGVLVAIWKDASGGWTGGYVDYCPQSVSSYTWAIENIVNGYGGPGSGAQVGFFTMSTDCSLRSSVSFTTWP